MRIILLLLIISLNRDIWAQSTPLEEVALFTRCYMHLTQQFPSKSNPRRQRVEDGSSSAITECVNLLNETKFTDNETISAPLHAEMISNETDERVSVLNNFHRLHYSWFAVRHYTEIAEHYVANTANIYDPSTPSLYITRALFDENANFSSVFTGSQTLRAIRESESTQPLISHNSTERNRSISNDILNVSGGYTDSSNGVKVPLSYEETGLLKGIKVINGNLTGSVDGEERRINEHWGGGVLGSQAYMLLNVQGTKKYYKTDGGVITNRKWSRSIFSDFFCRSLPVLKESDIQSHLRTAEETTSPFRLFPGCVVCHATIDPMAATTRNTRYAIYPNSGAINSGRGSYMFLVKEENTTTESYSNENKNDPEREFFPPIADTNFYRRPTTGLFRMRGYDGNLISETPLTGVEDLGAAIKQLDDPYICMAKRYYEYFTGISVNVENKNLSQSEQYYRNIVIQLGKDFHNASKGNGNPKYLIEQILRRNEYSLEDYGISQSY